MAPMGLVREVRWVVRPEDGRTVDELVKRAGGDERAVADGRVFVGRVRATRGNEDVRPGDVVTVRPPQPAPPEIVVLAREDGLVAADKPAGMPTIADQEGAAHSLQAALARKLGCAPRTLHPTSRLDRMVSGVVVFALDRSAAERLAAAREAGAYRRRYVAIACGAPVPPEGEWDAPIGRAKDPRKRAPNGPHAIPARTRYATIARAGEYALLLLEPVTGRTHQLRVHAAHAGAPLLGDKDYGGQPRVTLPTGEVVALRRVALHAMRVEVPKRGGGVLVVRAEVPVELRGVWRDLGGRDEDWESR